MEEHDGASLGWLVWDIAVVGRQAPARPVQPADAATLSAIRAMDRRVATIGHRLAVANLSWCARTEWRHGLVLLELSDIRTPINLSITE